MKSTPMKSAGSGGGKISDGRREKNACSVRPCGFPQSGLKIIRSRRKTLGMEINADGLTVRAPLHATDAQIRAFLEAHRDWIESHLQIWQQRQAQLDALPALTAEELRDLADRAREVLPERVAYYAPRVGVTYGKITIRTQRSRWGSCSSKGNLSFNCLLMLAPPEVLDGVVVHELCHRRQMNHSPQFYAEVLRVYPEYRRWDAWLRENGPLLLLRAAKQGV